MAVSHSEAFERALLREREWSTRWLNALRPAGVGLFLALHLIFVDPRNPGTKLLAGYLVVAVGLWVAARYYGKIASMSALAIPLLDMPAVFLKQWLDSGSFLATNPRAISTFTVAVFILLIMLSASVMRPRWLLLSGAVAISLQSGLEYKALDTDLGKAASASALALAVLLCALALSRRVKMVEWLCREHERVERLQRYFSPQVATKIQAAEDELATGHEYEITVLFSDLVGFTAAAETASPAEVVVLLNEVHSRMVEVVFANGGTLDKYTGDGLMAYFGAPIGQPDHAVRGMRCAQEMQAALASLNAMRTGQGSPALWLSIGLHSGRAVVGAIGAPYRREFTAVGDTVNVAARIENLTRSYGERILLSGETARSVGGTFDLRPLGKRLVRGRSESVEVYAPNQAELLAKAQVRAEAEPAAALAAIQSKSSVSG